MTTRVCFLYVGAILVGAGLFAAGFFTDNVFILPLLLAAVMTLAHLGVGLWWLLHKPRTAGVLAILAGASWATWLAAEWEEYQAQSYLPIINIAGLPAFVLTPIVLVCVIVAAMRNRTR
ncbi:hypothetical protein [Corynebacterium aurimucosum]|uniref:hypothetical protein n=1 Tax=Corynebacterium aurimucosum TaxID=169292 RepID=UPI001D0D48C3|nr:hypothetical protein [Corynebacterium aurimucosum]